MAGVSLQPFDGRALQVAVVSTTATATSAPAGTVGSIIKVYKLFLVCTATTNLKFQDGSTDLTGAMALAANGAITLDLDGQPWFSCGVGNNFSINNSAATQVSGAVYYTLSPWANQ